MHRPIKEAIKVALTEILINGKMADKFLPFFIRSNKKWGSRDRRTIAAAGFDIVRHAPFLQHLNGFNPFEFERPQFEALIDTWDSLGSEGILHEIEQSSASPAIKYSIPFWLYDKLSDQYGSKAEEIVKPFLVPGPVCIRINTRNVTLAEILNELEEMAFAVSPTELDTAFIVSGKKRIDQSIAFQKGYIEVQDLGSQMVINNVVQHIHGSIAETCAGEGGKTMQLANLFPQNAITAYDIDSKRLRKNQNRAHLRRFCNITHDYSDTNQFVKNNLQKHDTVIIDAPCSGSGTIKRQPDLKYHLTQQKVDSYAELSSSCLYDYLSLLNQDGKLIYITCSLFQEENQMQIEQFSAESKLTLLHAETILPSAQTDGFYVAVLGN